MHWLRALTSWILHKAAQCRIQMPAHLVVAEPCGFGTQVPQGIRQVGPFHLILFRVALFIRPKWVVRFRFVLLRTRLCDAAADHAARRVPVPAQRLESRAGPASFL